MTEPSPLSLNAETQKTIDISELERRLQEFRVDASLLAIVGVGGGEQFLGELPGSPPTIVGKCLAMKNPKRFSRLQQLTGRGMAVQFLIGDLDMIEEGFVQVFPAYGYYLHKLDTQSYGGMLELLLDFLVKKGISKSRLVLPPPASSIVRP